MTTTLIVTSLCLLLVGALVGVTAVREARVRHWLGGTIRGLVALLLLALAALAATVTVGLQGYRALTFEEVAATVRTEPWRRSGSAPPSRCLTAASRCTSWRATPSTWMRTSSSGIPGRACSACAQCTSSIVLRAATTASQTSGRGPTPRTSSRARSRWTSTSSRGAACLGRWWTRSMAPPRSSPRAGPRRSRCGSRRPVCSRDRRRVGRLPEEGWSHAGAEADPVAHQDVALRGHAGAARRRSRARSDPRSHAPLESPQPRRVRADRRAQRVVPWCDGGVGAVRARGLPTRPGVRLDRSHLVARDPGVAAAVDGVVQRAGRAAHELQQHDRSWQPGVRGDSWLPLFFASRRGVVRY